MGGITPLLNEEHLQAVLAIINLDVPTMSKAYLHRTGRTGRAGAKGLAVSLVTESELRVIRRYQQELGITTPAGSARTCTRSMSSE